MKNVLYVLALFSGIALAIPSEKELTAMFKSDSDSQLMARVKMEALDKEFAKSKFTIGLCDGRHYNRMMSDFSSKSKRGDPTASLDAHGAARLMGTCATYYIGRGIVKEPADYAQYASAVGVALSAGLVADGVKSRTPNVERALAYLEFAERNGKAEEVAGFRDRLLASAAPAAGINKNEGVISMTAEAAVAAYNGNQPGFKIKYEKKPMKITGKIHRIGGNEKQIEIQLFGNPKKQLEDMVSNDFVNCRITDTKSKETALNLVAGKKVIVNGVYVSGQTLPGMGQIVLLECTI